MGLDDKGDKIEVEKSIEPKRMSREDKEYLEGVLDKDSIKNVDINLLNILREDNNLKDTMASEEYLKFVDKMSHEGDKDKKDINLTYDLRDLKKESIKMLKDDIEELLNSEKKILEVLLEKQDVENRIMQIAQSENEMLEVIISNINDKALETIGDTVIESDMSSIYEDYEEDIKQVL